MSTTGWIKFYDASSLLLKRYAIVLLLLVGLAAFANPAGAQDLDLISWWKADGNALDSVSGNNGSQHGGVTYVPGVFNQAFSFDGTGGIGVADNPDLYLTQSLTLSAWVKVEAPTPSGDPWQQILFRGDDRNGLDPYFLAITPSNAGSFSVCDSNNDQVTLSAPIDMDKWVLVTGTLDNSSGTMTLYFDSENVSQTVTGIRPFGALDPTQNPGPGIGDVQANSWHTNEKLTGDIDDVRIYGAALSQSDIGAYYASAIATSGIRLFPAKPTGGESPLMTLDLNLPAPYNEISVNLSSSNPSVLSVPSTITFPAGSQTMALPVQTSSVSESTVVTVSATVNGVVFTRKLWVVPVGVQAVVLSPPIVTGGDSLYGNVILSEPAGKHGVLVHLNSSNPSIAWLTQNSMTIASGDTTGTFPISTAAVSSRTSVSIDATADGVTHRAKLTVTP